MTVTPRQIEDAIAAMHRAGRLLLDGQAQVPWKLKKDGTFVTSLDLTVEEFLSSRLASIFPGCRFVGEEDPQTWPLSFEQVPRIILDPIDGTAPFARGLKHFGISLAVVNEGSQPLLAIIYLPGMGRWCAASFANQQATRYRIMVDGETARIAVLDSMPQLPDNWKLSDSYLYISSDAHRQLDLSAFQGKVRALGATAAHLALLTDSTIDPAAVALTRYKAWDVAAGLALASAAGLEIRNLRSGSIFRLEDLFEQRATRPALIVGHAHVLQALSVRVKVLGGD